jgi:hypothetical protein
MNKRGYFKFTEEDDEFLLTEISNLKAHVPGKKEILKLWTSVTENLNNRLNGRIVKLPACRDRFEKLKEAYRAKVKKAKMASGVAETYTEVDKMLEKIINEVVF